MCESINETVLSVKKILLIKHWAKALSLYFHWRKDYHQGQHATTKCGACSRCQNHQVCLCMCNPGPNVTVWKKIARVQFLWKHRPEEAEHTPPLPDKLIHFSYHCCRICSSLLISPYYTLEPENIISYCFCSRCSYDLMKPFVLFSQLPPQH